MQKCRASLTMFFSSSKRRVEDVVAGCPADLDAVGGGLALFADGQALQSFQVFRPEHPRRRAVDAAAQEGDAAREETHGATSEEEKRWGESRDFISAEGRVAM